ncbi:FUSC family protein [Phyllobacterium sp. TAF24]|uniref:FUSC family protein n=1 Tax=Phyllobacterium sp. TAF24 TaxID=3233068 RepID=UPI003F96F86A
MYIAPRPLVEDDPYFPLRMAVMAAICVGAVPYVMPTMPPLFVALPIGLIAGLRKAFDIKKAIGGPLVLVLTVWLISGILAALMHWPAVFLLAVAGFYFTAFYLIQNTGNPIGMLILVAVGLASIMGMNSVSALESLGDSFLEAGILAVIVIPALYFFIPPVTQVIMKDEYSPSPGDHVRAALIRSSILLVLSFWLYSFIDMSNMMMVIAAIFVLCFPTRQRLFAEAWERIGATIIGACAAGVVLLVITIDEHYLVLIGLTFLMTFYFAHKMMSGCHAPMVYQFSLSVALSLIVGALTTQEPVYAAITRIVLTVVGTMVAALCTAMLETMFRVHSKYT